MEELLALQAELARVQEAPSVFKLSEPNVVELMRKLSELGLLEVLFTTNGKEYLTPKQLHDEARSTCCFGEPTPDRAPHLKHDARDNTYAEPTRQRLRTQVEDEIVTHGGRINITELPPILNVDLTHIERVRAACAADVT